MKEKQKEVAKKEFNFNQVKNEMIQHFDKSIDVFKDELKKMRTGRATVALIEDIKVDYYNNLTPLKQVATLTTPDATTILVNPWDKGLIKNIEKAIVSSGLGFGVSTDGNVVRVTIPPLTEERKKEIVKLLHSKAEEAKVAIRNVRHKYLEEVRDAKKEAHISEDLEKKYEQEIDKITHEYLDKIEKLMKEKEKEIMEV
jgi:ribosome recycling factor